MVACWLAPLAAASLVSLSPHCLGAIASHVKCSLSRLLFEWFGDNISKVKSRVSTYEDVISEFEAISQGKDFVSEHEKKKNIYIYFFFLKLINLFLAVLGLRFCTRAFSSCGKRGPLFIALRGPLTIATSLVAEHRLQTRRLSSCGSRAYLLRDMWDLPRPGLEPASPALAGRFSPTAPPGKPYIYF